MTSIAWAINPATAEHATRKGHARHEPPKNSSRSRVLTTGNTVTRATTVVAATAIADPNNAKPLGRLKHTATPVAGTTRITPAAMIHRAIAKRDLFVRDSSIGGNGY